MKAETPWLTDGGRGGCIARVARLRFYRSPSLAINTGAVGLGETDQTVASPRAILDTGPMV